MIQDKETGIIMFIGRVELSGREIIELIWFSLLRAKEGIDLDHRFKDEVNMRWAATALLLVMLAAFVLPLAIAADENSPGTQGSNNIRMVADLGFRPEKDGFNFTNYGQGAQGLTPDEMRRLFGDGACISSANGRCSLGPAGTYWMEFINSLMDGGHCMGLATLSLLFFEGFEDPSAFGAGSTHNLNSGWERTSAKGDRLLVRHAGRRSSKQL